eukprot:GHVU01003189.1.p2 GENE.GHVU01003189.1~~GHVU01003189.1.p2  ORF type:complete len:134 (+),score=13.73 GHVU01003189.1:52-453(+)
MVSLSLRRCHNFAGPDWITIMVVSATERAEMKRITTWMTNDEMKGNASTWLTRITDILDRNVDTQLLQQLLGDMYMDTENLKDSGVNVYVRASGGRWYLLTNETWIDLDPQHFKDSDHLPDFLVTGSEGTWPG